MKEEKFVLRKERNFVKTILFLWFYSLLIALALHNTERGPPATLGQLIFLSTLITLLVTLGMGRILRPLTPLTMIIDWDKELLYLSDRKEESITVRFNEIKWVVYHDIYRRRGISVKLLNGRVHAFGVTVNSKDKERLLRAIAKINEIIEKKKRLQPSEKVK